jgi:hypothetical protein
VCIGQGRAYTKKLFSKGLNGVGKEKKFNAKKRWYKKELV